MRKLERGMKLLVASHNPGKVREINALIEPFGLEAVSAAELDIPEPVEDGVTFGENAAIKALACAKHANMVALSDDSGLEVEALDGQPGIYSARWGGEEKDFDLAMEKVLRALENVGASNKEQCRANFTCALCLAWPDGETQIFEGKVFGHITWPIRGKNGFGYDPLFVPDGHDLTFGEMDSDKKHKMSHRANAFKLFVEACFD